MGKKTADKSLLGKKPINSAARSSSNKQQQGYGVRSNPSHIGNKLKRSEMYGKYLQQKQRLKREQRLQREKQAEALGEEGAASAVKRTPQTIDSKREAEATMVDATDPEIVADEADDEFSPYFSAPAAASSDGAVSSITPKVLITTRPRPSQNLFYFIADLQKLIPGLHFYPRKSYSIKKICQFAGNRDFTHLIVLSEKSKVCNGMTVSHLGVRRQRLMLGSETTSGGGGADGVEKSSSCVMPRTMAGPTAFFRLTNVVTAKNIPNHGASTSHVPELNLHGFGTRLGHRVGRLLASLFPLQSPQFRGRQVATFHNQRDYIFVRHHRYVFNERKAEEAANRVGAAAAAKAKKTASPPRPLDTTTAPTAATGAAADLPVKTRLQELGPRFTLKLKWLQEGTFDTAGEYEFLHKRKEMDTSRRKFHL